MIKTKLYLYDSTKESDGYRGLDLSAYLLQGDCYKEDLTQVLDSGDITLEGYPLRKEFAPETKLILDKYETLPDLTEELIYTYHICVEKDVVEQNIMSDNNYFSHHIFFIEPSVIAQKRVVDNISATYKLSDVSLETRTAYPDADYTFNSTPSKPTAIPIFQWQGDNMPYIEKSAVGKYLEWEGGITLAYKGGASIKQYNDISVVGDTIKFLLPKLAIYKGVEHTNTFEKVGYASIGWTIEEYSIFDLNTITRQWSGYCPSYSNFTSYQWEFERLPFTTTATVKRNFLFNGRTIEGQYGAGYNLYTATQFSENGTEGTEIFETVEIDIAKNRVYVVKIERYEYGQQLLNFTTSSTERIVFSSGAPMKLWTFYMPYVGTPKTETTYFTSEEQSAQITTQIVDEQETLDIIYQSSTPYSALSLLTKAVVCSGSYDKIKGQCAFDLNAKDSNGKIATPYPFYVDENFITELNETQVVENFYQQKNLWEIATEVGYYIHAVPKIVFGENDRFMISFDRLGQTEQKQNVATAQKITNFKGIEDYISSTSSYVANLVQLGGQIDEWVAPKSSSQDYLVYNDVAEIKTTKPIIEFLKLEARAVKSITIGQKIVSANSVVDITKYLFEENIYKLLDITTSVFPNKGVAIYYSLGDNVIKGLNYRSPAASSGDKQNDYAIKKILYTAFFNDNEYDIYKTDWTSIQINDFVFHTVYRTKDDARLTHTRPDLRKYLLSNKYDYAPQHYQFNNQQDILLDSEKFGSNIYGKLLRTGNSNFTVLEWASNLSEIKHKGELYRIDGDLYYVATAKHTFYANNIASEITYSKDYNQLSQIIGIPSEPRFYEISEQSLIRREIAMNDYLLISNKPITENILERSNEDFDKFTRLKSLNPLINLMLGKVATSADTDFAKYALVNLKGDKNNDDLNSVVAGSPTLYKSFLLPLNAFSSHTTLTYTWDFVDNFSVGDKVSEVNDTPYTEAKYYREIIPVGYTDQFGKASLMDFMIFESLPNLDNEQITNLPNAPYDMEGFYGRVYSGSVDIFASNLPASASGLSFDIDGKLTDYNEQGIVLEKDCREALSVNYNIQTLTDSDTFVLSPFLYEPNKDGSATNRLKCCFVALSKEVNKFTNGFINSNDIIGIKDANGSYIGSLFDLIGDGLPNENISLQPDYFTWSIDVANVFANANPLHWQDNTDGYAKIRAFAIIMGVAENFTSVGQLPYKVKFVIARNVEENETKADMTNWFVGVPNPTKLYREKQ